MYLLNCRNCDDVLRIVEKIRCCECGKCSAHIGSGAPSVDGAARTRILLGSLLGENAIWLSGPWRVLQMPWREYDGAAMGELRGWSVVGEHATKA